MHSRKRFSLLETKGFFNRELKTYPGPVSPSRRMALKKMSLILIGFSPVTRMLGKALSTPFQVSKKGKTIRFIYGGEIAWAVNPKEFGKNAVLKYRESERGFFVLLKNAVYPGSGIRADFKAAISNKTGEWQMHIRFPHLGINKQVAFIPWLRGKVQIEGFHRRTQQILLGKTDWLFIPEGKLRLDKNWQLRIHPDESVAVNILGSLERFEGLTVLLAPPLSAYWVMLRKPEAHSWIMLEGPRDKFKGLTKLETGERGFFQTPEYPFRYTGLVLSERRREGFFWASNETPDQSNLIYQSGRVDGIGLSLFRSRFVKEYSEDNEYFGLVADLGDNPQWYGHTHATFGLAGSATAFFSLFGEGTKVYDINCKARIAESAISVQGARSLPVSYTQPVEVEVQPQDPIIQRPQKVESGKAQNFGIFEFTQQQDRTSWLYVNKQSLKLRLRVFEPIKFNLVRPEDFLNLQFEFANFKLENNILEIDNTKDPAFFIVNFPSQHLREQAFEEFGTYNVPVQFLRAGNSRLVFRVPSDHPPIRLVMSDLLDWSKFELQVNYRARWFNTSAAVSLIRARIRDLSVPLGRRRDLSSFELRPGVIPVKSRNVRTITTGAQPSKTTSQPMTAMELKVAMASTPRGSSVMSLDDQQLTQALATPEIELSIPDSLSGAMRNLLEMKPPSHLETSIEAPVYAEISPNQFAGFTHSILLKDEFEEYNESSVHSLDVSQEGALTPVKPSGDLRIDPSRPVKRSRVTVQPLNRESNQKTLIQKPPQTRALKVKPVKRTYKNLVSPQFLNIPGILAPKTGQLFELWHTRMGVRLASGEVDEDSLNSLKTVRVIWSKWANEKVEDGPVSRNNELNNIPGPIDFHELVHLTSNYTNLKIAGTSRRVLPEPVKADQLMLSGMGAWFDYAFKMDTPVQYTGLIGWDQRATMGRDHFIKVVRRGFLFPFGHKAVKITTVTRELRKVNGVVAALLVKREYIKVTQPELYFSQGSNASFVPFPFQRIEIKDRFKKIHPVRPIHSKEVFELYQPRNHSASDTFKIIVDDASGKPVSLEVPLVFIDGSLSSQHLVVDHYNDVGWNYFSSSSASRSISYARSLVPGDTSFETQSIIFGAEKGQMVNLIDFYPEIKEASVFVRQIEELTGDRNPVRISLVDDNNLSMVFARVIEDEKPSLVFGDTEKSGGFLTPNMAVSGFSKLTGISGNKIEDLEKLVVQVNEIFNLAEEYMPKIFGIISFVDLLLPDVDLSGAISAVKSSIEQIRDQIEELQSRMMMILARIDTELKKLNVLLEVVGDLLDNKDIIAVLQDLDEMANALESYGVSVPGNMQQTLQQTIKVGKEIWNKEVQLDNISGFIGNAQALKSKLEDAGVEIDSEMGQAVDDLLTLVSGLKDQGLDDREISAAIQGLAMAAQLSDVQGLIKNLASQVADTVIDAIPEIPNVKFQVKGDKIVVEYHWKPKTKASYSAGTLFTIKNLNNEKDQIEISLDSILTKTLDLKEPPDFDVNASIREFSVVVADSLQLNFQKIAFKSGTSASADVDVKFKPVPVRLIGSLSFVNSLQSVIQSDQFSGGPYINITENGIVAGYNFPLPNIEVGILAISNMMLGTKLILSFNKDPLKLGFNFCSPENPFKLMVSCFGGGGFFMMETTMQGLTRLDAAFEFGAGVSLNVGVASGSVEVMGGFYYTLIMEDDINKQSMAAYLRMTGRLSIIGLIKVTLEFYLEMVYEAIGSKTTSDGLVIAGSSQLKGRATLSVKVEILFFSKTVKVTVSRTFAGNDADPKFKDSYTLDHWQSYCSAFAS